MTIVFIGHSDTRYILGKSTVAITAIKVNQRSGDGEAQIINIGLQDD